MFWSLTIKLFWIDNDQEIEISLKILWRNNFRAPNRILAYSKNAQSLDRNVVSSLKQANFWSQINQELEMSRYVFEDIFTAPKLTKVGYTNCRNQIGPESLDLLIADVWESPLNIQALVFLENWKSSFSSYESIIAPLRFNALLAERTTSFERSIHWFQFQYFPLQLNIIPPQSKSFPTEIFHENQNFDPDLTLQLIDKSTPNSLNKLNRKTCFVWKRFQRQYS